MEALIQKERSLDERFRFILPESIRDLLVDGPANFGAYHSSDDDESLRLTLHASVDQAPADQIDGYKIDERSRIILPGDFVDEQDLRPGDSINLIVPRSGLCDPDRNPFVLCSTRGSS